MINQTNIERLKRFLVNGGNLTKGQAKSRFGIRSMASAIRELRAQGYAVYENQTKTGNGDPITLFRLGSPTRRVVSAGFQALSLA